MAIRETALSHFQGGGEPDRRGGEMPPPHNPPGRNPDKLLVCSSSNKHYIAIVLYYKMHSFKSFCRTSGARLTTLMEIKISNFDRR